MDEPGTVEKMLKPVFAVVGGTLYVDGCEVEVYRDNTILDLRIKDLDPSKIESIQVFLDAVRVANLAAATGSP